MAGLLLALSLASGCASVRAATRQDAAALQDGQALAMRAIEAHGGLARWRAIGGVGFHLTTEGPFHIYPRDTEWLLDPAANRGRMSYRSKKGRVEYRFDGRRAVIVKDGRCGGSARQRRIAASRVSNVLFWFGVPWKFRDPGSQVRAARPASLQEGGPRLSRYLVTYRGVGATPEDWFLVWLDPGSARVRRVSYVASEFSSAVELDGEWQRYLELEGLALVTRRVHRPRNRLLRRLARPLVQELRELRLHQPLHDSDFVCP